MVKTFKSPLNIEHSFYLWFVSEEAPFLTKTNRRHYSHLHVSINTLFNTLSLMKKINLMFTEATESQSSLCKPVYSHTPKVFFLQSWKMQVLYGHKHRSLLTPIVRNIERNTAHPSSTGLPMHQRYQWQSTCRKRANQFRIKMAFKTKFIATTIHNSNKKYTTLERKESPWIMMSEGLALEQHVYCTKTNSN